jgi:hypothetical protein
VTLGEQGQAEQTVDGVQAARTTHDVRERLHLDGRLFRAAVQLGQARGRRAVAAPRGEDGAAQIAQQFVGRARVAFGADAHPAVPADEVERARIFEEEPGLAARHAQALLGRLPARAHDLRDLARVVAEHEAQQQHAPGLRGLFADAGVAADLTEFVLNPDLIARIDGAQAQLGRVVLQRRERAARRVLAASDLRQAQVTQHSVEVAIEVTNPGEIGSADGEMYVGVVHEVFGLPAVAARYLERPGEQPPVAREERLLVRFCRRHSFRAP